MADRSTAAFDPYHKWLGIPPAEQPPDHYRLLGVTSLESDPDVIAIAADRQMAHVKSFATGPHATDSQKLLAELSRARVCLLNPTSKQAYDDRVRALRAATGDGGRGCRAEDSRRSDHHPLEANTKEDRGRIAGTTARDPTVDAHSRSEPIQLGAKTRADGTGIAIQADWATARVASHRQTSHPARGRLAFLS